MLSLNTLHQLCIEKGVSIAVAESCTAGLIASNKSMQNRQAEIAAMREAKLNGIPIISIELFKS